MCAPDRTRRTRRTLPRALAGLLLLWAVGQARPAAGAPPPEATRLFNECVTVFEAGQLEAARACFERVQAVYPSSVVLSNLGRVEERLGHLPEAYEAYRRAVDDESRNFTEAEKRDVRRRVGRLAGRVGILRLRIPVSVATVTIDGRARGGTAAGLFAVAPGTHEILVEAPLVRPWRQRVTVTAGQMLELAVRLGDAGPGLPMAEVAWPQSAPTAAPRCARAAQNSCATSSAWT